MGAAWTGIYPIEERVGQLKKIFDLPEHIILFGQAVMGCLPEKQGQKNTTRTVSFIIMVGKKERVREIYEI